MATFSDRFKMLRKQKKLTQIELADKLSIGEFDFSPSTISMWENGKRTPPLKTLDLIADFFNVDMDYLRGTKDTISRINPSTYQLEELKPTEHNNAKPVTFKNDKGVRIPVLGYVAAGVPIDAIEEIIDWEEIPKEMAARGEYFGLKIKGDSMAPDIKNKDVVIVRQQPDAESDEIVIVTINGDEGVCKKLRKSPEGITLISRNPAYEPIFFTPREVNDLPVTIVGKVVELRRSF
jgi:repressor LexA